METKIGTGWRITDIDKERLAATLEECGEDEALGAVSERLEKAFDWHPYEQYVNCLVSVRWLGAMVGTGETSAANLKKMDGLREMRTFGVLVDVDQRRLCVVSTFRMEDDRVTSMHNATHIPLACVQNVSYMTDPEDDS